MATEEITLATLIDSIGKKIKKQLGCCSNDCQDFSLRDLNIVEFIGSDKKTMGDIAEELELTPGTITPIIDKLIEQKLLKRERDEEIDRRKVFISLDKKGKTIFDKHMESKLQVAKIMMNSFSKKDKLETIELMKKIDNNLDNTVQSEILDTKGNMED